MQIVITGANGCIGRILTKSLSEHGHDIIAIDNASEGSPSQRFVKDKDTNNPLLREPLWKEYYQIDITDKDILRVALEKIAKIDVLIHLAALSDDKTPLQIQRVNEGGTENIFQLCQELGIRKVILASSIMTVWGKLVDEQYYLKSAEIEKVTPDCILLPKKLTAALSVYIHSKIKAEELARFYFEHGNISSIAVRFGAISSTNLPYLGNGLETIWCSHRDACSFVLCALDTLEKHASKFHGVYYACSKSNNRWMTDRAEKELSFVPEDSVENFLVQKMVSDTTVKMKPSSISQYRGSYFKTADHALKPNPCAQEPLRARL